MTSFYLEFLFQLFHNHIVWSLEPLNLSQIISNHTIILYCRWLYDTFSINYKVVSNYICWLILFGFYENYIFEIKIFPTVE